MSYCALYHDGSGVHSKSFASIPEMAVWVAFHSLRIVDTCPTEFGECRPSHADGRRLDECEGVDLLFLAYVKAQVFPDIEMKSAELVARTMKQDSGDTAKAIVDEAVKP